MLYASKEDVLAGVRLYGLRLHHGLNARVFAELIGVTDADLLAFERGQKRIDATTMQAICRLLKIDAAYFSQPLAEPAGRRPSFASSEHSAG
jgi:transcriptional regulator with XRE-family HTH domain